MTPRPNKKRHRTLVLSWHPEDGYLSAGGFRRGREIVKRLAPNSDVVVVDAAPSIYRDVDQALSIVEYTVPRLVAIARVDARAARAVQWSVATVKLVWHGLREFRQRPYDTLYVPTSELLVCSLPAVVLKTITRRRLVMSNLNVEGIFARRLTLALHNRADAVTVLSEALGRELAHAGVYTPIDVTGCGPPVVDDDVPDGPVEKNWDGIFVGRHTPEKGILDLFEIWRLVREKRAGARLVLVGACAPETRRRIEALISALNAERDIELAGVVSDRRKFQLLRASRVLIAPSSVEGWGLVPLEALHVGVPVVCWDLPAYRESLPESDHVVRIPVGDADTFARKVLEVLDGEGAQPTTVPPARYQWPDVAAREWEVVSNR